MKKVASLLLALMMLVVSCVALADSTVEAQEPEVVDNVEDLTTQIAAALESGSKASDIFGEDAKALMALYLPAGTDLDTMELGAPAAISMPEDYDPENPSADPYITDLGDVTEGKNSVAVIVSGDAENGYTCVPVKLEDINGKLVATMSPYVQSLIAAGGASCVIANTDVPAEEEDPNATTEPAPSRHDGVVVAAPEEKLAINASMDQTPTSQEALDSITQAVVYGDAETVIDAFGEETKAAVQAMLPEGVQAEDLEMSELSPLAVEGEVTDETKDPIVVAFEMPTAYEEDATLVALVGVKDAEGNFTWTPQTCKVLDGHPIVYLQKDVASTIGADGVLAILNN